MRGMLSVHGHIFPWLIKCELRYSTNQIIMTISKKHDQSEYYGHHSPPPLYTLLARFEVTQLCEYLVYYAVFLVLSFRGTFFCSTTCYAGSQPCTVITGTTQNIPACSSNNFAWNHPLHIPPSVKLVKWESKLPEVNPVQSWEKCHLLLPCRYRYLS